MHPNHAKLQIASSIISPPLTPSKARAGEWGNEHCPEHLPHCWRDGLEAHLLDGCSSGQPTTTISNSVHSALPFPCHTSPSTYVRPTVLTHNHPIGQFVRYVQHSYFPASLCSQWKYYALYFAFDLCPLITQHSSLEQGGAEGNPGADLHPAPFQHPYTRKSTTTPSGVHSLFAGLPASR